jgi:AcrR family transcriptional regulator
MAMTKRGERTKESFRSGARQVIAQKGFLRTTISEIAAAAGRSPASFYNYYDSKEALLEELADDFRVDTLKRQQMTIEPGTPIYDVMLASAAAYWESYKTHLAELVGVFQVAMVDDRFAQRWRDIRVAGIETIKSGIDRAQAAGYCPGIDPWLTAGALGSMFEHFCYVSLAQGGAFSHRSVDETMAVKTIAAVWFHAVYWTAETAPQPTFGNKAPATARRSGGRHLAST